MMSVLLVDDDTNFRRSLAIGLETSGCQVHEAQSGMEALEFLQANQKTENPVSGIVIEAFGCGSIPPEMLGAMKEAMARGILIVVASRSPQGGVYPIYAFEGGGRHVFNMGAIFAGRMSGQHARIFLMAALGHTSDPDQIRELFNEYNQY